MTREQRRKAIPGLIGSWIDPRSTKRLEAGFFKRCAKSAGDFGQHRAQLARLHAKHS